jgi:phenylalanyl-tRNA synthetase beta chain
LRVSLAWLREYIDIPLEPEELADRLTMQGLAVDAIERVRPEMEGIVVGKVLDVAKHPNADRLVVCRVDAGAGEPLDVVCGAPNVKAGTLYPFAPPGARLPDGTKIKRAKIRGERSNGMLCSGRELGLSADGEGILELDPSLPVGGDLVEALGLEDVVLEIDVMANRFDLLSHRGVAREIRAIVGGTIREPDREVRESGEPVDRIAAVDLEDPEGCPRYMARVIRGVRVGPSPPALVRRLESVGMRSVNNVVDAANHVMLGLGHPIHTFDLDALADHRIVVRRGREGETMVSLDGEERSLDPDTVVIADAEKPVAIGGIMGSLDSEVHAGTTDLLIECAHFDPIRIRRTSRRLGLPSQASFRFERWVDPNALPFAIDRVTRMITDLAGGSACAGVIDRYPRPIGGTVVRLRPDRARKLLGAKIETSRMAERLRRIDLPVREEKGVLRVDVPTSRRDISREVDLIEEVARLEGYDKVEAARETGSGLVAGLDRDGRRRDRAKRDLVARGFREVCTSTFLSPEEIAAVWPEADGREPWNLRNPISSDARSLRPTLLPGLLRVLRLNASRNQRDLRIFEIGTVFAPPQDGEAAPRESVSIAGLMAGRRAPVHWMAVGAERSGFFDMKGAVVPLLRGLGHREIRCEPSNRDAFHPGRCADVIVDGRRVGFLGELHPDVADAQGLTDPPLLFELDGRVLDRPAGERRVFDLSPYPSIRRDISLLVPAGITHEDLDAGIRTAGGGLLEDATLYDIYRGPQVPEDREALTFALVFRSKDRTLVDAEVDEVVAGMLAHLETEYNVMLRPSE